MHRWNDGTVSRTPDVAITRHSGVMRYLVGERRDWSTDVLNDAIGRRHQIVLNHVVEQALIGSGIRMKFEKCAELAHQRQHLPMRTKDRAHAYRLFANHLGQLRFTPGVAVPFGIAIGGSIYLILFEQAHAVSGFSIKHRRLK